MRLIGAEIAGFGRLASTMVNLDSKVIAVVGPNEAGKTTLLKALAFVDGSDELSPVERSRAIDVAGDMRVIRVKFALDDRDRAAIGALDLQEVPELMFASRTADGGDVVIELLPSARKRVDSLKKPYSVIERATARKTLGTLVSADSPYGDPDDGDPRDFLEELTQLASQIRDVMEGAVLDAEDEAAASLLAQELMDATVPHKRADPLRNALNAARLWLEKRSPGGAANDILWRRTPEFLLFAEPDRTLRSSYTLDTQLTTSPPAALEHLARMAQLDLQVLVSAYHDGDIARRETALTAANNRLKQQFTEAWKQSALSVQFAVDGETLRVLVIENGETITVFDERSAGLRMFIALFAFLSTRDTDVPPILLIDEAENHLHIDAQADLVTTFMSQEQAARVIYTTHSPACLPPDLGVGIRAVVPSPHPQVSDIQNHFWGDGPGFSPLMIAMGAAAAAFTPARRVILGEGATEMILLPSLLRAATGLEALEYQVAPGLSEVPRDFLSELDMEAAKVAYLLDGDAAGEKRRIDLVESGVPAARVVVLDVPGLENLLPAAAYLDTVSSLLLEMNNGKMPAQLPKLRSPEKDSWASQLTKWAAAKGIRMPSKVAVANRLVQEGRAQVDDAFLEYGRTLHAQLLDALRD